MLEDKMNMTGEAEEEKVIGGAGDSWGMIEIVNCDDGVPVRSTPDPSRDDNIIGYAYPGEHYLYIGWCGDWLRIKFGGSLGYIPKDYMG